MTEVYLYETSASLIITDNENHILAETIKDDPKRTIVYIHLERVLQPKRGGIYSPGEEVCIRARDRGRCNAEIMETIRILRSKKIPIGTYEQWKNKFFFEDAQRRRSCDTIYKKLEEEVERLKSEAQERITQLPELPSLEQLVED